MDQPILDRDALFANLRELEYINRLTGGPPTGFKAIRRLLRPGMPEVHIVDVGFGAGDMLCYLLDHAHALPCPIRLTGIDIMPETLDYIGQYHPHLPKQVQLHLTDYADWFAKGGKADIIHAGLFCHHLDDGQLVDFFDLCQQARLGAVVNDLVRDPLPYYFIKAATALLARSPLTRHDAPLSVLRAFTRAELEALLLTAGVSRYSLQWKWAYRYLLTIYPTPP
jgi:2-polyprenyl-3-methyl-5-hydroxy-6-metoxy-1,4-benzoquinol methylase